LREHEQEFLDKGARFAIVSLGDRTYARIFQEETGIEFPLRLPRSVKRMHLPIWVSGNVDRYEHLSQTFGDKGSVQELLQGLG
jgi:hypothetical protein